MKVWPLIQARLALYWETLAPVLWPAALLMGLYASVSIFGLWDQLGDPWRAIAYLAAVGFSFWLGWKRLRTIEWPDGEDAARRVEDDSGISARPHEALIDRPARSTPEDDAVWAAHQKRMAERLKGAHARRPHAAWAKADSWGLRGAVIVLIAAGWIVAGDLARGRLFESFGFAPVYRGVETAQVDIWLNPPAYTGLAPIFFQDGQTEARTPAGSELVVRTAGVRRAPNVRNGRDRAENRQIGDGVWQSHMTIGADAVVTLRAGRERAAYRITAIADTPPDIRIAAAPDANVEGELILEFEVDDDYGATGFQVEFRPEGDTDAEWFSIEIDPNDLTRGESGFVATVSTAQHELAGSRVDLRIAAQDGGGNTGRSPSIALTLPERVFLDPLARAVSEQRRIVIASSHDYAPLPEREPLYMDDVQALPPFQGEEPERRIERASDDLQRVALALDAMTDAPEYFFEDRMVYLGLRNELHRLRRARSFDEIGPIEDNLWQIALRAELGSLADAERALRAAERALMEALARGADETELAPLFEAYQQAMDNYLAALAREAAEEGRVAEGQGQGGQLNTQGLQELLDALRDAAELGDTANAREALQSLGEMLRNLELTLQTGEGDSEQSDAISEAMREALEELGDVIGEQRQLQDETFDQAEGGQQGQGQPGQPGQPGGQEGSQMGTSPNQNSQPGANTPGTRALADAQGDLASRLESLAQALPGESGESFGDAAEAMRRAQEALENGDAQGAVGQQEQALQSLRDGAEQLAQNLLERAQDAQQAGNEGETDPLGRPRDSGGFSDGAGVEIPDEAERLRAREILEELRERAAEQGLDQDELDYIERLLDRFGS
ncbi:DUF4175 family protein [Hyphobacterium sp. HN65]|uniref:DUF4175 family protein n=1 Tax=Hyphobacterium lacteum TaxID=3116575 RepID=A0ABU7LQ33_9PROT|nr:DUF4175 family protein [Hyphobacterium sp. HN65]MEE2526005.1 DUF4175 family protein [Hyphobacterium sp. HN65]